MRGGLSILLAGFLMLSALGCGKGGRAGGRIRAVATIPVLQDIVANIGGEKLEVKSLITGLENPHTYEPKASDIRAVAEADVLFEIGLGLEAWVERLVKGAGNPKLKVVDVSQGIGVIERRGDGKGGNPHIWMDPQNVKVIADNIRRALSELRPQEAGYFAGRYSSYASKLDSLTLEISREVSALEDRRVVSYPPAFPYFFRRFGFVEVARIIDLPGKEPSAKRISEIIDLVRGEKVKVIVTMPQYSGRVPDMIAAETGAEVVELTPLLGAFPGTETYIGMISYDASELLRALSGDR